MQWTEFLPAEHAERRRFFPCGLRVPRAEFECAFVSPDVTAGSRESWPEIFGDMSIKPDGGNRRQSFGFRRWVGEPGFRGWTALHNFLKKRRGFFPCPYGAADRASLGHAGILSLDRKSTRLNSSHLGISYAVFCLK